MSGRFPPQRETDPFDDLIRPSIPAITSELRGLREKPATDITVVEQAVQLLETLPDFMTDEEDRKSVV